MCTRGHFRENVARIDGRKYGATVGITPTETSPVIEVFFSMTSFRADSRSRTRKKRLAEFGECDRAAQAVKEPGSQFIFELSDLLRERWLRHESLPRGSAEASRVRNRTKVPELVEFH
jgi:hypothetical protein